MIWSMIFAKVLTTVMSWIDAGNLRNRLYQQAEEMEIMHTGLEDIVRMDPNGPMGRYAQQVLDLVKNLK